MSKKNHWLPQCLSHWNESYLKDTDKIITIGKLSSEDRNGYNGVLSLRTALVPLERRDEVLNNPGGIGWEVESW